MIHNFLDGLVLVAAYSINHALGLTTLLAIALHEIPRELGDYGVLVHAGFSPRKAAWLNFSTSIFSALGVVVGSLLSSSVGSISLWLLPVAAGSFLYVGMSDLLPMLREGDEGKSFPWEVLMVVLGAFLVGGVGMFLGV
jgi:zinc and cadmium transporter